MKNKALWGHILASATVFVWGTTFVSTKILLQSFLPIEILIYRFCIGIVALFVLHPKLFIPKNIKQELYFAAAGLSGITFYFLFENIALSFTSASNVGVILSVAPMFTVLALKIVNPATKLHSGFIMGFIAALAGIFILSFGGDSVTVNPKGDFLAFLSAMVWAVYSILIQKINTFGLNQIQVTRRIFTYGTLFILPVTLFVPFKLDFSIIFQTVNILNLLYLGVGASAICFVTWNIAVSFIGPIKTSVYIYATPVVTVFTSMLVLQEKLTLVSIIGIVLTLLGLFLSERKSAVETKNLQTE